MLSYEAEKGNAEIALNPQTILEKYGKSLQAVRAYAQYGANPGFYRDQRKEITATVEKDTQGAIQVETGCLCVADLTFFKKKWEKGTPGGLYVTEGHDVQIGLAQTTPFDKNFQVKGFTCFINYPCEIGDVERTSLIEILQLDPNESRAAFDELDQNGKIAFAQAFGSRVEGSYCNIGNRPQVLVIIMNDDFINPHVEAVASAPFSRRLL
ncbi:hypothetical protein HGA88_00630 [Candidatus Roizmanbacteria bacterium]|nr:hypothetical protein [Candidatus Roizmanbacteria bacterium]